MDLRGQDHKRIVMPSSFVYNPPIREPTTKVPSPSIFATVGGGGRREGSSGNGAAVLSSSHAFEHLHIHPQHSPPQPQPQPRLPDPDSEPEADPDPAIPVSVALDVVGATTSIPIVGVGVGVGGGGSNPRTPSARNEASTVRYRECLKNHAASTGGHVVDGCGEFMPGGEEGTPEALKCAACECHRNFHRKEADGEPHSGANYYYYNTTNKANGSRSRLLSPSSLPPPPVIPQPIQQQKFPIGLPTSPPSGLMHTPMMMAFGGGGGGGSAATDSSSEEHHVFHPNAGSGLPQHPPHYSSSSKTPRRFRTKFSKEQKDKMLEFAERVGWRMQKQDEPAIQQFCAEVGVKRQVLKVWMHNNKHTIKKKEL